MNYFQFLPPNMKEIDDGTLENYMKIPSTVLKEIKDKIVDKILEVKNPETTQFIYELAESEGLIYPPDITEEELRGILLTDSFMRMNRGMDSVYTTLAKSIFRGKGYVQASFNYHEGERTTITLEINANTTGIDGFKEKQERFLILAENLRPINVGFDWSITLLYMDNANINATDEDRTIIYMNDTTIDNTVELSKLNNDRLNEFKTYGVQVEEWVIEVDDKHVDEVIRVPDNEDVSLNVTDEHMDFIIDKSQEIAGINGEEDLLDSMYNLKHNLNTGKLRELMLNQDKSVEGEDNNE